MGHIKDGSPTIYLKALVTTLTMTVYIIYYSDKELLFTVNHGDFNQMFILIKNMYMIYTSIPGAVSFNPFLIIPPHL